MSILKYFGSLVDDLTRKSETAKDMFSTHKPSVGDQREESVMKLLRDHLPKRYGVSTGLITSEEEEFSNQSDLIITDIMNNAPLFNNSTNKIWLAESVYAVIEIKTQLTPSTIKDCLKKCRRFKKMKRNFFTGQVNQRILDSLFIIWSFEAPSTQTFFNNYKSLIDDIPIDEQPDFVICPNQFLVTGGSYKKLVENNKTVRNFQTQYQYMDNSINQYFNQQSVECLELKENSLFTLIAWLTAWLQASGDRTALLGQYVANQKNIGVRIL